MREWWQVIKLVVLLHLATRVVSPKHKRLSKWLLNRLENEVLDVLPVYVRRDK